MERSEIERMERIVEFSFFGITEQERNYFIETAYYYDRLADNLPVEFYAKLREGERRKQWEKGLNNHIVQIMGDVLNLMNKAVCKLKGEKHYEGGTEYFYGRSLSYGHTWIQFNGTKIEGIAFSKIKAAVWKNKGKKTIDETTLFYDKSCLYGRGLAFHTDADIKNATTKLKAAKLVKALFPELTDNEVSTVCGFIADYRREILNPETDSIQISDTPSKIYNLEHKDSGNLGSSCMRSENSCRFQIYDDIQGLSIAYIKEDGKLIARALLHENAQDDNGTSYKLMDRIYSVNSEVEAKMICWAKKNGYTRKSEQSAGHEYYIMPDGKEVHLPELFISADGISKWYDEVPYVDTFCYYHDRKGCFSTDGHINGSWSSTCLQETDGSDEDSFFTDRRNVCCCCGERISEDDVYSTDNDIYCSDCFHEHYFYCERCGDYESTDEMRRVNVNNYKESWCQYCAGNSAYYCDECGEYFSDRHHSMIEDGKGTYCQDCAERIGFSYCEHCDEPIHPDDIKVTEDNVVLCEDCFRRNTVECPECGNTFYNEEDAEDCCETEMEDAE